MSEPPGVIGSGVRPRKATLTEPRNELSGSFDLVKESTGRSGRGVALKGCSSPCCAPSSRLPEYIFEPFAAWKKLRIW